MRIWIERVLTMKLKGRVPRISVLVDSLEVDLMQIIEALSSSQPLLSLTDASEDGDGQIDIRVEAPDEEIGDLLSLRQIMTGLSENDKMLIYFRYYKNFTQHQTAEVLNMTQVQVSRKEKKLLLYMREKLLE